jgi:hypothetical protein
LSRADREFLAGWTFAARVVGLHGPDHDSARGGILEAIGGGRHYESPENRAGQAEAYLAAWGF